MYLRGFHHWLLIAIAVMLMPGLTHSKSAEYPCPDAVAIQWVRDPAECSKYFICHFGKPLTMPGCPMGQVWGNDARNCVPEGSRWDDCSPNRIPLPKKWNPKLKHENEIDDLLIAVDTKKAMTISLRTTTVSTKPLTTKPKRNEHLKKSKSPYVRFTTTTMDSLKVNLTEPNQKRHDETVSKPWKEMQARTYSTRPTELTRVTTVTTLPTRSTHNYHAGTTPNSVNRNLGDENSKFDQGSVCWGNEGLLLPHEINCHWYYNCSLVNTVDYIYDEPYVMECRYPQLFDIVTNRCREFINVHCGNRFEAVDRCEYTVNQCTTSDCVPCEFVYGKCRGKENGIYPLHSDRWSPTFVTCYSQRSIAQDDCQEPSPIFSTEAFDCVSIYEVPKQYGGLRPECYFRPDGYYPDEQSRCGMFFECKDQAFVGYDKCPSGLVFDPLTLKCESAENSIPPCGSGMEPQCFDREDGFHADPYGRCGFYFECKRRAFVQYHTCDYGSFDPYTEECVISTELLPRPCGLLHNPCEGKSSGFHADTENGCRNYYECGRGVLIRNDTCPHGSVFNELIGRCDRRENVEAPCGEAPTCHHKSNGKYAAQTKGCSFYYECYNHAFQGYKQCSFSKGGFFFNNVTNRCDFPQNICPPCGYRWWGCSSSNV
ncbi:hypothetical protein SNE40_012249 [Patella caerulea]|uniref:Chitin-binding type-2 domain-containing protein n=1 Tax=Patella caerulea TaxID=87958 RepID=A0AAN8PQF3_PATCE